MTHEIQIYNNASDITSNIPQKALEVVNNRLPELINKTEAFGRKNSQTSLTMMTLTMMTGQSPMRQIRQILAEIDNRSSALAEAQVSYEKLKKKIEDHQEHDDPIEAAQHRSDRYSLKMLERDVAGLFKDLATLTTAYDRLVEAHGYKDWDEERFEKEEAKFHVRRAFQLMYSDVISVGRPKPSTIEYMQQFGVHAQVALKEVLGYTAHVEQEIAAGNIPPGSHLEDFFDEMANKYQDSVKQAAQRMFGVDDIQSTEFMMNWNK